MWILIAAIQCGWLACYSSYVSPPMPKAACLELARTYQVPPQYRAKSSVNCVPATPTQSH
jgi:hypothetical protein